MPHAITHARTAAHRAGWVRTGLGGPGARMTVEESVIGVVDTIEADHAIGELRFVDYKNQTIPW
jgi:RecB family exonuclease